MNSEQYYPTYKFQEDKRDILLIEFTEAQSLANSQTKTYGQLANITLAIITIAIPVLINQDKTSNSPNILEKNGYLITFLVYIFGLIILRYFVDLQKQITINARKVVTLRTMLGLDYGNIQLTLPNWRVEGASSPFAIKYFNGWFNFTTTPFWLISIGISTLFYFSYNYSLNSVPNLDKSFLYLGITFIFSTYYFVFRRNLNDLHETTYLNLVKTIANLTRFEFIDNFEHILYRVKLAAIETGRLKINTKNIIEILITIEDQNYYKHNGVNLKSLTRAFMSHTPFNHKGRLKSGGSTITMQLTRTLFILQSQNKYLRKVYEIMLSIWLNGQFSKNEIINFYLSSVRFEKKIYGLPKAINYFFNDKLKNCTKNKTDLILTNEEAFVLIERLSNITSTYSEQRIKVLKKIVKKKLPIDDIILDNLYCELESRKLITKKQ